jgi:L-lactate permease
MNTTQTVVATAAIVVAGRWQQEKPIDVGIAVGGGVFAIGLSILSNFNEEFAKLMGYVVLVAALYMYGPTLANKLGFAGELDRANKRKVG